MQVKQLTAYKLPETTKKSLLIGVTVVNTYHLPSNQREHSQHKHYKRAKLSGVLWILCKLL